MYEEKVREYLREHLKVSDEELASPSFQSFCNGFQRDAKGNVVPLSYILQLSRTYFSPQSIENRSRLSRISAFLSTRNNIGIAELISVPRSLWTLMVAPFSEGAERRKNWESLLSTCWGLRNHLMALFERECPKEKYGHLLEGCYISCSVRQALDFFVKIEGEVVVRGMKGMTSGEECIDEWKFNKVQGGDSYVIKMDIQSPVNEQCHKAIKLPQLVFKRYPKVPYPVKIIKYQYKKVSQSEFKAMKERPKKYVRARCAGGFSRSSSIDIINNEIALGLFSQVPKDFAEMNKLMFAMPEILESASYKLFKKQTEIKKTISFTEDQQKEEVIKEMIKLFPSLSDIFKNPETQ